MGINNGHEGFVKASVHSGARRLAIAKLFTDAFEHQDVGIHAHADGEDDTGDAGQRQHGAEEREDGE